MSRPIAVLRPAPGNRVTAAAIEAAGRKAIRLPLFEVRPIAWEVPDPAAFDALLLTSANALRHGGPELAKLLALPVYAVGEATAAASERAGFHVAHTGSGDSAELLARAEALGVRRALHLAGRDRTVTEGGIVADIRTLYASDVVQDVDASKLEGAVVLIQSARAGARLAEIALNRQAIALVAISPRAAEAAGSGWEQVVVPRNTTAAGLVAAAIALAD